MRCMDRRLEYKVFYIVYIVSVMMLNVSMRAPVVSRDKAHPSMTYASTVRPSAVPVRNLPTSSFEPKVANSNPASLTLATRLGTAAYTISASPDRRDASRHTRVVASKMTPSRLVDLAKLTASRTDSDRRSASSSGPAGMRDASVRCLEIPQYEAKKTASCPVSLWLRTCIGITHSLAASNLRRYRR